MHTWMHNLDWLWIGFILAALLLSLVTIGYLALEAALREWPHRPSRHAH
jgi:hypothetical protein